MTDYRKDIGKVGGVWSGTYRRMDPQGKLIEEWRSRQESRGENGVWYERVTYSWADGRAKTMDFKARLEPDGVHVYEKDTRLRGRTYLTGVGQVIFPYVWHDTPGVEVLEVQHYINANRRTRVWQRFEQERLTEIMVIQEDKLPAETPAIWY